MKLKEEKKTSLQLGNAFKEGFTGCLKEKQFRRCCLVVNKFLFNSVEFISPTGEHLMAFIQLKRNKI